MLWKIGNVDLVMVAQNESIPVFAAEINTLNSTQTIIHHFGYGSRVVNFRGVVVGNTKKALLENYVKSGNYISIVGPLYSGNVFVKDYSINRELSVCQTIDPTEPSDAPVYTVALSGIEQ